MVKDDKSFAAQRIRDRYVEREMSELDELRELDARVSRPVNILSYLIGSISAVIMGAGMSLVMTDLGSTLGIENSMVVGIAVGIVGLAAAVINYPLHRAILSSRRRKFAPEILSLSERIING